jgi:pyruvate formate lyase activating enzyme
MQLAKHWKGEGEKVKCLLCPNHCLIPKDRVGICKVRKNLGGKLYSLVYAKPVSINVDPIEKKPLYHFNPGSAAFSYSTVGCNFSCRFCQNWTISQASPSDYPTREVLPERMVVLAKAYHCHGIAHTYTEPTVFYEYAYDIAKLAKEQGLYNVWITNAYIEDKPLKEISPYLDAANIDLKGFNEKFYREICGGNLEEVLESIKRFKRYGIAIELTTLLVPGYNDDPSELKELCSWIRQNCGASTPLHFSRFFPHYQLTHVEPTPIETLKKAYGIAKEEGLRYVYIGNVPGEERSNTYCWNCEKLLIRRFGFSITEYNLKDKRCPSCGVEIDIFGRYWG